MAILLYNIVITAALPFLLPFFLYRLIFDRAYRKGIGSRFGILPPEIRRGTDSGNRYWFHAVSVGEVMAAAPLIRIFKERHPDSTIIFSTVTSTGNKTARDQLPQIDHLIYFPFDFIWMMKKAVKIIRPRLFIFFETEIWPNLLTYLEGKGIPSVMVNGRISDKSFKRYKFVRPILEKVLDCVTLFSMQTDEDRAKIIALGADPDRVFKTGNTKYDRALELIKRKGEDRLTRSALNIPDESIIIVAGSTHQGEEEILIHVFKRILGDYPDTVMIVAPRHLDRLARIESQISSSGLPYLRRSSCVSSAVIVKSGSIIILDTLGELSDLYKISTIAFVGGSLVPAGGHNILEPAVHRKPVIFGPYMDNFREIGRLMAERGGAMKVNDGDDLYIKLCNLLPDKGLLEKMGREACEFVKENSGAAENNMKLIERFVNQAGHHVFSPAGLFRDIIFKQRESILLRALLFPLTLFSYLFLALITIRRLSYRAGILKTRKLDCRVVSIGNLTVGGTGKTPFVIFLAGELMKRGRSVAVITRGYKGRSKEPISLVSDRESIFLTPSDAGDEAFLIASKLKGVPVIIGKDRCLAGEYAIRNFQAETILLDDGFQNLSLKKDTEILLIDATTPAGNGYILPRGILREPFSSLCRSSAIILTRTDQTDQLDSVVNNIRKYSGSIEIYKSRFRPTGLKEIRSGKEEEAGYIKGKRLILFSGIGNPGSFRRMVEQLGGEVIREIIFPDHHNYLIKELENIELFASRNKIDLVVTTEKDGVKIAEIPFGYLPVWALRIGLVIDDLNKLEDLIVGKKAEVST